jgi:hypothetical protein
MAMPVKWVAELSHVREVTLLGTADLAYWQDRLREEKLDPAERDGQAQVMVSAAELKYWGVRFREVSFSVQVRPVEDLTRPNAAYLLGAYNSLRMFAFVERIFFSTPYRYGDVRVSASLPAFVHIFKNDDVVFRAEMGADGVEPGREPSQVGEDGWDGPVFLPEKQRSKDGPGRLFFARVRGHTRAYPLLPARDVVAIKPSSGCEVLQALSDSHFVAQQWNIREDAAHAKSKTYKRTDLASLAESLVPKLPLGNAVPRSSASAHQGERR